MAVYKIFPSKDATIYSEYRVMNTGLDPILACSSYISDDSGQVCRTLIQFSDTEINNILNNLVSSSTFNTYLRLFASNVDGMNLDNIIEAYPVSGSWGMGTGREGDITQTTNGVSWEYRTSSGSNQWVTSSFPSYVTASFHPSHSGGGTWYTGSTLGLNVIHSQSFSYNENIDIKLDVTTTIRTWYSGGLPNNGFILKQRKSDEFNNNTNYSTTFEYFSVDTHTIYPPELEFRWNDYSFSTGSSTNSILSTSKALISLYDNTNVFFSESIQKFRIAATPKYPTRTFSTSSVYNTNYYLPPSNSIYAIKDTETNLFVVDFDPTYTRISADATSSYFTVYMGGLQPERYYTILLKTVIDGSTIVFDEDLTFKVING